MRKITMVIKAWQKTLNIEHELKYFYPFMSVPSSQIMVQAGKTHEQRKEGWPF